MGPVATTLAQPQENAVSWVDCATIVCITNKASPTHNFATEMLFLQEEATKILLKSTQVLERPSKSRYELDAEAMHGLIRWLTGACSKLFEVLEMPGTPTHCALTCNQ